MMSYCRSFQIFQSTLLLIQLVSVFVAFNLAASFLTTASFSRIRKASPRSFHPQGCIVASLESLLKRAAFFKMRLIIMSGLPNSMSVKQEMDALYVPFKSATYARGNFFGGEDQGSRNAVSDGGSARSIVYLVAQIQRPCYDRQWQQEWWALNETFR